MRTAIVRPFLDMLDWLDAYLTLRAQGGLLEHLVSFHNEHRLLWIRLLTMLDVSVFAFSGVSFIAASTLALLVAAGLVMREAAHGAAPRGSGIVWLFGMLFVTFAGAVDCSVPVNAVYPLTLVFAVACICLFDGTDEAGSGTPWRRCAAMACAASCGFGNAAGLLAWPVLAWTAWRGGAGWRWLAAVAVLGAAYCAAYLHGVTTVVSTLPTAEAHAPLDLAHLLKMLRYLLAYLGLPFTRLPVAMAPGMLLGALLLLAGSVALLWLTLTAQQVTRLQRVAGGLILFALGSAALAAVGRADLAAEVAVPVRYTVFVAMLHAGLLALALPPLLARPGGVRLATRGAAGLAVLLLALQVAGGYAAMGVADRMAAGIERFYSGERGPAVMEAVYRDAARAEAILARLRAEGLYRR